MQSTIAGVIKQACCDIDRIDAHLLLQYVLNVDPAYLLTHTDQCLSRQQALQFKQLVARRVIGEPVAYLVGEREFYSLTFCVNNAVLIPRPETELLVDLALARIPQNEPCKILDLGTGSGAVAITIARHRPASTVVAVDYSAAAIAVAQSNAKQLQVKNIEFRQSDWFEALAGHKFDLIVSNPPYVAECDPHLRQGDLRFEPLLALSTGEEGLACIRHIINKSPDFLVDDGWLLLEHGHDQAPACRNLLTEHDYSSLFSEPDLAGIIRVSGGRYTV